MEILSATTVPFKVAFKYISCVCVCELYCFPLTLFFSRLLQTCPGAVRKTVHDAQEHAETLREHRQLFCLWPPLSQHGGFFWSPGQLPHPLHGEYTLSTLCAYCIWGKTSFTHIDKQKPPPTHVQYFASTLICKHVLGVAEHPKCLRESWSRLTLGVKTLLSAAVLQSQLFNERTSCSAVTGFLPLRYHDSHIFQAKK